jgi:hypothetical protein
MKNKFIITVSFILIFRVDLIAAQTAPKTQEPSPPEIGILSMPTVQELGPLVSFGQNVIDKHNAQILLLGAKLSGQLEHFVDVAPSFLYGITDTSSVLFTLPYAVSYKQNGYHSSGIEDTLLQFEYAFYQKSTYSYYQRATAVLSLFLPTGSSTTIPNTGNGSPTFFLGTTFNRTYVDWFIFTSPGTLQTTTNSQAVKYGNQYYYQGGLGKSIFVINGKLLIALILEMDGTYIEKTRLMGAADPNSGGNTIITTPSFWLSTHNFTLQLGFSYPIYQRFNGHQPRIYNAVVGNVAWAFI